MSRLATHTLEDAPLEAGWLALDDAETEDEAWLTELACTRDSVTIHLRDVSFKLGLVIIVELILLPLLLNLPPPAP